MPPDLNELQLPGPLRERYQPERLLGRGSFGRVLRAQDVELGRVVAVKLLDARLTDEKSRARFLREAKVTAQLDHPNIVQVFDSGCDERGSAWIVYQYVEGFDLDRYTDKGDRTEPKVLVRWCQQVAEALAHAHARGVVHRDLKPANVMLDGGEVPLVCDFGIARDETGETKLTATGTIMGTYAYMAPEVWMGGVAGPEADQYSWAASVFELLYKRMVYDGVQSPTEIFDRICAGNEAEIPPRFAGKMPAIEAALVRALAIDPKARFPDMGAFAEALTPARVPLRDRLGISGAYQLPEDEAGDEGPETRLAPAVRPAESDDPPTRAARAQPREPAPAPAATGGASQSGVFRSTMQGSVVEPAPPRPARPWWAGLVVAAGLAYGLFGGGSDPRPPATPPAPSPSAAATPVVETGPHLHARSQEVMARAAVARLHLYTPGEVPDVVGNFARHPTDIGNKRAKRIRDRLLETGMLSPEGLQLHLDALQALGAWIERLADWQRAHPASTDVFQVPEVRASFRQLALGWVVHHACMARMLHGWLESKVLTSLFNDGDNARLPSDTLGEVEVWLREMRAATLQSIARDEWPGGPLPSMLLAFQGLLRATYWRNAATEERLLERIVDRYDLTQDDEDAYWLGKAAGFLLATNYKERTFTHPTRDALLARLAARLERDEPWADELLRLKLRCRALYEEARMYKLEASKPFWGEAATGRVIRYLDALEAALDASAHPGTAALIADSLDNIHHSLRNAGGIDYAYQSPDPIKPFMGRMKSLRDRAKSMRSQG